MGLEETLQVLAEAAHLAMQAMEKPSEGQDKDWEVPQLITVLRELVPVKEVTLLESEEAVLLEMLA